MPQRLLYAACVMQELEEFYRALHSIGAGAGAVEFPPHYPTSVLLGTVSLVDSLPVRIS